MPAMGGSKKWIEAGYELLAKEGPNGIQVEKLARQLDLNKSGFYHYFGDREVFVNRLLEHHLEVSKQFLNKLKHLRNFDPEYIDLLIEFRTSTYVQMQLRRNSENPYFKAVFEKVSRRNDMETIALWAAYLNIPNNQTLSLGFWQIARDVFYLRLTFEKMNPEYIRGLVEEVKGLVARLQPKSGE